MNFDSPLVEYLIIGFNVLIAIILIGFAVFGIPFVSLLQVDAGALLILLPFAYLIGMLFDSISRYPLEPFRKKIRDSMFSYEKYKDEYIALMSPTLYSAYDARIRRVRIVGAAIFTWPILGFAILLHLNRTAKIMQQS